MTFFFGVIFLLLYFIPARLKPPPAEAFCFCVRGFFFMVLFVSNLLVFFLPSARVVLWGFFFRARLWVAFSTRGLGGAFRERLGSAPPNLAGAHLT